MANELIIQPNNQPQVRYRLSDLRLPRIPSVYCIKSTVAGRFYIGSTKDFSMRIYRHKSLLKLGQHYSSEMQKDFDDYGIESFVVYPLEFLGNEELCFLKDVEEAYLISSRKDLSYNTCPLAHDSTGYKHTPEVIASFKGKVMSRESREKMSKAQKGRKLSPERIEQIRQSMKGRVFSPEHKAKLSTFLTARNLESAKNWIVVDPSGGELRIKNLNRFCKDNGLDQAAMQRVAVGKVRQHKGWKCRYAEAS